MCVCVCTCTELLNADSCIVFIVVSYDDVVWMFSSCVWKQRCGFLLAFLGTAAVGQVCEAAVGLRCCRAFALLIGVHRVEQKMTWVCNGPPRGHTCWQPELLPKSHFLPQTPNGSIDETQASNYVESTHCYTCVFFSSKTPSSWAEETRGRRSSGGHKRSASWGSAEHLREASISVYHHIVTSFILLTLNARMHDLV